MAANQFASTILQDSPYRTVPLHSQVKEIRLLCFAANQPSDTLIACQFSTYALSRCPSYTALSYTWGDSEDGRDIMLNRTRFKVRKNLWQYLYYARGRNNRNWYWIDAICIDQSSTLERNHQATVTAVWLGPGTVQSDAAMDWISSNNYPSGAEIDAVVTLPRAQAVLSLCTIRYWRRIWIVQEILRAGSVILCCGWKTIDWDHLLRMYNWFRLYRQWPRVQNEKNRRQWAQIATDIFESEAGRIIQKRSTWNHLSGNAYAKGFRLDDLLLAFPHMESTDPRDMVYALLGLVNVNDLERWGVTADYSKSTSELFLELLRVLCDVREIERGVFEKGFETAFDELTGTLKRLLRLETLDSDTKLEVSRIKTQYELKFNASIERNLRLDLQGSWE